MGVSMSPEPRPIKVIIFDVDGTLVTDALHLEKHHHVLTHVFHHPDLRLAEDEWNEIRGLSDGEAYRYIVQKARLRGIKGTSLPHEAEYVHRANAFVRANLHKMKLRDGAFSLLQATQELGLKIGVATNADWSETYEKLTAVGIQACFSFFSCLDGVLRPKPFPDLFENAIRQARESHAKLQPTEVLIIEDTWTGVTGALQTGCRVILWQHPTASIPPHADFDPKLSHLVITDQARDVVEVVRKLCRSCMLVNTKFVSIVSDPS